VPGLVALRRYGTIPANHENAMTALGKGAALLVYPGGDHETYALLALAMLSREKAARGRPSLISRLEPPSNLGHTMESLEIIVLPVILIGALLIGVIWTTTAIHWLRSTKPLR
jgi:hypothetical protein